jgi:hypothetical protein
MGYLATYKTKALLTNAPPQFLATHYAPAQRACIDCDIYTSAITFVYRMMVRSYEGRWFSLRCNSRQTRRVRLFTLLSE